MNIYINGMELPPKDTVKMLVLFSDGTVIDNTDGQNQWQAIEVPPHGRLGDLDNLERMFSDIDNAPYSGFDGAEPFYSADDAAQIIRLAHTIIPADLANTGENTDFTWRGSWCVPRLCNQGPTRR